MILLDLGQLSPGTAGQGGDRATDEVSAPAARPRGSRRAAVRTRLRALLRALRRVLRATARNVERQLVRLALPLAVTLVLVLVAALALVGGADVEVSREHDQVAAELARGRSAAARIPGDLARTDTAALAADLDRLARSGDAARSRTGGWAWAIAAHLSPKSARTTALRDDSRRLAVLGDAARPLPGSLAALVPADTGTADLRRLARDLAGYSAAADATADPSAPAAARAALATGLLPGLAGPRAARTWSVCRRTSGPCVRARVANGRVTLLTAAPGPATPPGHDRSAGPDLLIVGIAPDSLFDRLGSWDPRAVLSLLYGLGGSVEMRSTDAVEQRALQRLSHRTGRTGRTVRTGAQR